MHKVGAVGHNSAPTCIFFFIIYLKCGKFLERAGAIFIMNLRFLLKFHLILKFLS